MFVNADGLSDNNDCYSEAFGKLEKILESESIRTVFQPVISLIDGRILGYEALSRGPEDMESPDVLFSVAKKLNKLWELEYLCRRKALENAERLRLHGCIFLNVSPDIINNPQLRTGMTIEAMSAYGIDPNDVIIEITEKSALEDYKDYIKAVNHYKEQGYFIAIDDAGSGYSGLKVISDIRPHYVKLDMAIIRNVDKDKFKLYLIKSFKDFCGATGIQLIAEGVETQAELETLIEIGVSYAQGYFIQRPSPLPSPIDKGVLYIITEMQDKRRAVFRQRPSTLPVGHISQRMKPVPPDTPCSEVSAIFTEYPFIDAVPVVKDDVVRGIVTRDKFYARLGSQYGYSIFFKRTVDKIMGKAPLTTDHQTPIDVVSKMAMRRPPADVYDSIIVTRNSTYFGIVTVKDLLEKYTEMEISYARNLNPLTGLPGNTSIENRLGECLKMRRAFAVIYVDIDNFKPYNDVYGFAAGDRMIHFLADVLTETGAAHYKDDAFVGHVGGDDFVVIVEGADPVRLEGLCNAIICGYREGINAFYTPQDIENGGIIARNRQGQEEHFSISTLSVACVTFGPDSGHDTIELSERASLLKKKCKEIPGDIYLIE
jgi:EAL domain-containing protein (putative c-di-GMP-specific phosphodiesterase class I)/GGDEF domain-containing protein/CBS domain-containing protein